MFLCGNLGEHCADCGDVSGVSGFLCDYPVGEGKTCDRPMCEAHANEIAPDLHYCIQHLKMYQEFIESEGLKKSLLNVVPYKHIIKSIAQEE